MQSLKKRTAVYQRFGKNIFHKPHKAGEESIVNSRLADQSQKSLNPQSIIIDEKVVERAIQEGYSYRFSNIQNYNIRPSRTL